MTSRNPSSQEPSTATQFLHSLTTLRPIKQAPMPSSKAKGIPSWQKETPSQPPATNPAQNDDPVYAQETAATKIPSPSSEPSQSPTISIDDPVYSQAEAVPAATSTTDASTTPSQSDAASSLPSTTTTGDRASLLTSASKFLQHEDLHTASLEQKTTFLQTKGLTREEIDGLLLDGYTSATSGSTSSSDTASPASPPPIITYPEFLLHAHRPKPLVTRTRIVNAVYGAGLISGVLYLASRYLFEPMAAEMASARHELFETAQKGVEGLNARLEESVSVLPATRKWGDRDGAESVVSDPEELFHRDVGVQTSPRSEAVDEKVGSEGVGSTVVMHALRLRELKGHVSALSETGKQALEEEEITRHVVGDLQAYLDELAYGGRKSAFSWDSEYGTGSIGGKGASGKLDEIAKFKAEIRGVKGALLSARNFPAGGSGNLRGR